MTIDDALSRFLVQLEADGRSPHTIGQYCRHVRLFAAWCADVGPGGAIEAIFHEDIALFLASPQARTRRDTGAKKATSMNTLRSSLRGFFRLCRVRHNRNYADLAIMPTWRGADWWHGGFRRSHSA